MNRHTKIPAVIWLPLLAGLVALTLWVGLKAFREQVRITEEQSSPKYHTLVAPQHWVRSPQVEPTTQCNLHYDPEVLSDGWHAVTNSSLCLTIPYLDGWVLGGAPVAHMATFMNTGYNVAFVGNKLTAEHLAIMVQGFVTMSDSDGWKIWDMGLHQDGSEAGFSSSNEAVMRSPRNSYYRLRCNEGYMTKDHSCRDFAKMLELIPALNTELPYEDDSCPKEIAVAPATLAVGWKWESDSNNCYGLALPEDADVTKVDDTIMASFNPRNGVDLRVTVSMDRMNLPQPHLNQSAPVKVVQYADGKNGWVYSQFELTGDMNDGELATTVAPIRQSFRSAPPCDLYSADPPLGGNWRGFYSYSQCLYYPFVWRWETNDQSYLGYGAEEVGVQGALAEIKSRQKPFVLKYDKDTWQIWDTGRATTGERHAFVLSPDGRAHHLFCGDAYAYRGWSCRDFDEALYMIPAMNPKEKPVYGDESELTM